MPSLSTYRSGGSSSGASTGRVVQRQVYNYENGSSHVSIASTSLTATSIAVNITPTSSTNDIIIEVTSNMCYGRSANPLEWALYRSGDDVTNGYVVNVTSSYPYYYGFLYRSGDVWSTQTASYKDTSHDSSAQLTYTLYHRWTTSGSTNYTMHQGQNVVITATEITT